MRDPETLTFLDEGVLDGLWFWDLENPEHEWMSPTFWRRLGYDPADRQHLASEWQDLIYPEDLELAQENVARHLADPSHPYDQLVRYHTADGGTVTVRCRGLAVYRDGKPVRLLGCHTLVSDSREMLLDTELNHMLELSREAIYAWSPARGIRRWNRGAAQLYGVPSEVAHGRDPSKLTHAQYPEPLDGILQQLADGKDWSGVVKRTCADGTLCETLTLLQMTQSEAGDTLILEIDRDISAEREAIRRQDYLTRELSHRVKNLFAVMRGLVRMSTRYMTRPEEFADDLIGRIEALSAAHRLSLNAETGSTYLFSDLIDAVLAPYMTLNIDVNLSGPEVQIEGMFNTPLGLIFHELATNASKYGVLGEGGGTLEVRWNCVTENGSNALNVTWRETFARPCPERAMPNADGFGSRLIRGSVVQVGGTFEREFTEDGLKVSMRLPILDAPSEFDTQA